MSRLDSEKIWKKRYLLPSLMVMLLVLACLPCSAAREKCLGKKVPRPTWRKGRIFRMNVFILDEECDASLNAGARLIHPYNLKKNQSVA